MVTFMWFSSMVSKYQSIKWNQREQHLCVTKSIIIEIKKHDHKIQDADNKCAFTEI